MLVGLYKVLWVLLLMKINTEFWRDLKDGSLRLFSKAMHMKRFLSTVPISNAHSRMSAMWPVVVGKGLFREQYVDSASWRRAIYLIGPFFCVLAVRSVKHAAAL